MVRTFQKFEQLFDLFKRGEPQVSWFHYKRLARRGLRREPKPQKVVHYLLEGFAGLAGFFFQQGSYIVVEGESGSHIMMLVDLTS